MQKQAIPKEPVASYKEVRIGKTLYRVTSVFSGEKDLGRTLEQLAVRRAMTVGCPQLAGIPFERSMQTGSARGSV